MFHTTFAQIALFDWLTRRHKGSIFEKIFKILLLRNRMKDEAETWHTCIGHCPLQKLCFLAHLSRRLIGELIDYQWSVLRPSVVVHNAQRSFSLKPLVPSKPNFMWSLLG